MRRRPLFTHPPLAVTALLKASCNSHHGRRLKIKDLRNDTKAIVFFFNQLVQFPKDRFSRSAISTNHPISCQSVCSRIAFTTAGVWRNEGLVVLLDGEKKK